MDLNIGALRDCIGYADDGYQRNVIKKTEFYELVAICWTPGQNTPIHDHVGSDCAFLIADGVSTETIYQLNDEGLAIPSKSEPTNQVRFVQLKNPIFTVFLMTRIQNS